MSDLTITPSTTPTRHPALRTTARWMVSFLGFPLGGFAATLVVGAVDSLTAALIGGLITGTILGAAQSWGIGPQRPGRPPVDRRHRHRIDGRIRGRLRRRGLPHQPCSARPCKAPSAGSPSASPRPWCSGTASADWHWPGRPHWPIVWALGWVVTTSIGIAVDQQFIVFGASGALVVTALTAVLPLILTRNSSWRIMTRHVVFGTGQVGRLARRTTPHPRP